MSLAVKYEVIHYVEEVRERHRDRDKKSSSAGQPQELIKPFKGKAFRQKGRFKQKPDNKSTEDCTCLFCEKPCHIKANCFGWKKEQAKQGNEQPRQ
ncbi:hypothetical protein PR003_g15905 [Phytophthora rubi]|uniref:Uncharacterized protein n=1 Tax=Phytophthora rubi TaxID=129364 RepID=A0A6A3JFB8_9STRA|nr:hypothetical protein PR002_g20214 [Phytophthora rubi]KAE9327901.1 hypothetical protein PR003_g15905 [Phytophthora rubi]